MLSKFIKYASIFTLFFITQSANLHAYIYLYSKEFKASGVDLELDPYYSSISYYSGVFCNSTACLSEEKEESK